MPTRAASVDAGYFGPDPGLADVVRWVDTQNALEAKAILKRDQGPKRRRAWARIQSEPEFIARWDDIQADVVEAFRGMYEDQAFCAKLCLAHPVVTTATSSYRYRQHPASSSAAAASWSYSY